MKAIFTHFTWTRKTQVSCILCLIRSRRCEHNDRNLPFLSYITNCRKAHLIFEYMWRHYDALQEKHRFLLFAKKCSELWTMCNKTIHVGKIGSSRKIIFMQSYKHKTFWPHFCFFRVEWSNVQSLWVFL